MELPFIAFTDAATSFLDEAGICRRVEPANGKKFTSEKAAGNARRCVGAQYVASLDGVSLVALPAPGAPLLFTAHDEAADKFYLVRTDPLIRFHARKGAPTLKGTSNPPSLPAMRAAPQSARSEAPRELFELDEATCLYVSDDELEAVTGITRIPTSGTPTMRRPLPTIPSFGPVTPPGLPIHVVPARRKTG